MTPERWAQIDRIHAAAIDRPMAERTAFLDEACAGDPELRREVESLLAYASAAETFLDQPALQKAAGELETSESLVSDAPPIVPGYTVLQVLGAGGMGIVYLAEQDPPLCRRVALKLIKVGMDTRRVVTRFEAERQALALMDHPNIASVFDAGATRDGRPFFVMEYVPGVPITEFCDRHQLSTRARLELFQQVCGAIQHAHQKGVIHRDLKPSNVLVIDQDGQPTSKVIDFGIAKATGQHLTDKSFFTEHGLLVGTPEYMSPEQADGSVGVVDSRTDIYSLGILLYELLIGNLPFGAAELRRAGYAEIQRILREQEPSKPSTKLDSLGLTATDVATRRSTSRATLLRELRGDLDWITLKAIEKSPARRYASASELAADIGRHLHDEPVLAGPPGAAYRVKKLVRKHRGAVAAGLTLIGLLTAGLAVSTALYVRAERSKQDADRERIAADHERTVAQTAGREADRQREAAVAGQAAADTERVAAIAQRDEARYQSYRNSLLAADLSLQAGDLAVARRQLAATEPQLRGWEWRYLSHAADSSTTATASFAFEVREVRFSAAGDAVFARVYDVFRGSGRGIQGGTRGRQPTLTASKVSWRGRPTTTPLGLGEKVIAISPDGSRALSATWNTLDFGIECQRRTTGTGVVCGPGRNTPSQSTRTALVPEERDRLVVRETSTGRTIATLSQPDIGVWSSAGSFPDGIAVSPFARAGFNSVVLPQIPRGQIATLSGQLPDVIGAVFSADGTRLAAWSWNNVIHVWDLAMQTSVTTLRGHADGIRSASFDASGTRLVSTSFDRTIRVWSLTDGTELLRAPIAASTAVFSPNGVHIAAGTDSTTIQILEAASGRLEALLRGHTGAVSSVAFSPDSSRVVSSAAEDRVVRLWNAVDGNQLSGFVGHEKGVLGVAFSADGKSIASGARDGTVRVWQAGAPASFASGHTELIRAIAFAAPNGDLVSASMDRTVRVWNRATGELDRTFALDPFRPAGLLRNAVALSMRPARVAFPSVRPAEGVASPGKVWSTVLDLSTGTSLVSVDHGSGQPSPITQIAISPDGLRMADASRTDTGGTVRLWRVPSGRPLGTWKLEGAWPGSLALAPGRDGRRVAVTADGRAPSNPEVMRGRIFIFEEGHDSPVVVVRTSKAMPASPVFVRGDSLIAFGEDAIVRLWDLESQTEIAELVGHDGRVDHLLMSPDGTRLVTAGADNTIRVWDVARNGLLLTIRVKAWVTAMTFSDDGTRLAAAMGDGRIQVWDAGSVRPPAVR